jgi:zinc-ribbon domain
MALFRRGDDADALSSTRMRRPHPGLLRRERRALLQVREERLRDLGGLTVEMYRRSAWREDLLHERCAEVIGIDARLAEIDELLHGSDGTERCRSCGAPVLRSSHFCPNCGRLLDGRDEDVFDETLIAEPGVAQPERAEE